MAKGFHRFARVRCPSAPPASGYMESFATTEPPFHPSLRYINHPDLGYEAAFRNSRGSVQGAGQSHLDHKLIGTPDGWRPRLRHIDPGSGSRSERPFRPSRKMVAGPKDNRSDAWKSSMHAVEHVDESKTDADAKWKSSRHRPSTFEQWYLDSTVQDDWVSSRRPGGYTHQPEWIPPFREYDGKVPQKFYVTPQELAKRARVKGKRKSTMYNQFATTFDKDEHFDEFKKPLGGIKTRYKNAHQWPFNPLPPPRCKKRFYTHICHHEGVSTLLNPKRDYDYNSYVFL